MLDALGYLRNSSFVRSVGTLLTGASVAQLINLLLLPVLTQIFTPEDFDVLAVFTGISIITYRSACLGLDYALPVAETDEDAVNLLAAALLALTAVTAVVTIATVAGLRFADVGEESPYRSFLWLLPAATFLLGAGTAFDFWTSRAKRFGVLSRARIGQVVVGGAFLIVLGLAGAGALGLLIGFVVVGSAGLLLLMLSFWRNERHLLAEIRTERMWGVLRRYSSFPKYTAAEIFANSGSVYIPVVIIAAVLAGPEAGFLLLALRLLQSPLVVISQAISQVYYARAREARRDDRLTDETRSIVRMLVGGATGPFIAVAILAPDLAEFALGSEWRRVGVYMVWIVPAMFLLLVSSSVATSMHTLGRNADMLKLNVFALVIRTGLVALAALFAPYLVVAAYAAAAAIVYASVLAVTLVANRISLREAIPRSPAILLFTVAVPVAAAGLKFALFSP
ncbi:MAG: oligosaccharide flippase family protein [Allosphingosinicella sp.]